MTAASLGSSFLGLRDINPVATTAFSPPAQASLTADATSVTFELAVEVAIVQETPPPPPPAASGAGAGSAVSKMAGSRGVASAAGSPPSSRLPKGLTWVCCDDDELPRFFLEALVKKAEGASDSLVVGGKYGELEALPATIARLASEHGDEGVVVVLDENLELYGHPRIKGSEMCKQLRDVHNFGGVVVIYSANDEDESKEMAVAAGADGLIGKGVGKGLQMLHDTIAKWYERRFGDDSFKQ